MVQFFSLENPSWVVLCTFCITVWRYMIFAIQFKNFFIILGCSGSALLQVAFCSCSDWGYSLVLVHRLLIVVAFLVEHGPWGVTQQLWCMGLVTPQHVESSWTRDRTRVPCLSRWILSRYRQGSLSFF